MTDSEEDPYDFDDVQEDEDEPGAVARLWASIEQSEPRAVLNGANASNGQGMDMDNATASADMQLLQQHPLEKLQGQREQQQREKDKQQRLEEARERQRQQQLAIEGDQAFWASLGQALVVDEGHELVKLQEVIENDESLKLQQHQQPPTQVPAQTHSLIRPEPQGQSHQQRNDKNQTPAIQSNGTSLSSQGAHGVFGVTSTPVVTAAATDIDSYDPSRVLEELQKRDMATSSSDSIVGPESLTSGLQSTPPLSRTPQPAETVSWGPFGPLANSVTLGTRMTADEASTLQQQLQREREAREARMRAKDTRIQADKTLDLNRRYQSMLQQQLAAVEAAQKQNLAHQYQLKAFLEEQERLKAMPLALNLTSIRLAPPYFVDRNGEIPPDNADTIKRRQQPLTDKNSRWSEKERQQLRMGVIEQNRKILATQLWEEGDEVGAFRTRDLPEDTLTSNVVELDWETIAKAHVRSKTASECELQWIAQDHPSINKKPWTKEELHQLESLAKKHKERDWDKIALLLKTDRTAAQCFRQFQSKINKTIGRVRWTPADNRVLARAVEVFGERDWQQVAHCLDNRTPQQCYQHWAKSISPAIRRGRWTREEDAALKKAFDIHGASNWGKVQQHILGRTDVQCRERYMNVLEPTVKNGPWDQPESDRLRELVGVYGEGSWSKIASLMNGRTDNQCWRRWKVIEGIPHGPHSAAVTSPEPKSRKRSTKQKEPKIPKATEKKGKKNAKANNSNTQDADANTNASITPTEDTTLTSKSKRGRSARLSRLGAKREAVDLQHLANRILSRKRKMHKAVKSFHDQVLRGLPVDKTQLEKLSGEERLVVDFLHLVRERWFKVVEPVESLLNLDGTKGPQPGFGAGKLMPPSLASLKAFESFIYQGIFFENRYSLRHRYSYGGKPEEWPRPPEERLLTMEEQSSTEFKRLQERFDTVFLWPMLSGMLSTETFGKEQKRQAKNLARASPYSEDDTGDEGTQVVLGGRDRHQLAGGPSKNTATPAASKAKEASTGPLVAIAHSDGGESDRSDGWLSDNSAAGGMHDDDVDPLSNDTETEMHDRRGGEDGQAVPVATEDRAVNGKESNGERKNRKENHHGNHQNRYNNGNQSGTLGQSGHGRYDEEESDDERLVDNRVRSQSQLARRGRMQTSFATTSAPKRKASTARLEESQTTLISHSSSMPATTSSQPVVRTPRSKPGTRKQPSPQPSLIVVIPAVRRSQKDHYGQSDSDDGKDDGPELTNVAVGIAQPSGQDTTGNTSERLSSAAPVHPLSLPTSSPAPAPAPAPQTTPKVKRGKRGPYRKRIRTG